MARTVRKSAHGSRKSQPGARSGARGLASTEAGATVAPAMIPRYTPADLEALWSPRRRYLAWLDVELAACEAMERAGIVPEGTAAAVRPVADKLDAARIDEIELTTKHDVIAFLTHVEELAGPPARWLHR